MIENTGGCSYSGSALWPALLPLLPTILGLQQLHSGTDKYPQGSWLCTSSLPTSMTLPQTNRYIIIYTHMHARGHGHTDRTGRKGGRAGQGESHDPAAHPRGLSGRAAPHGPSSTRRLPASAPGIRVSVGKGRLGCSPAAPRPGIQLDVAVMGLSSSRSRLELPGWRLL